MLGIKNPTVMADKKARRNQIQTGKLFTKIRKPYQQAHFKIIGDEEK